MRTALAPLSLTLLLAWSPAAAFAQEAAAPAVTSKSVDLRRITEQQAYGGGGPPIRWFSAPQRATWAPDGRHYVVRRDGEPVWVDPDTGAAAPAPKSDTGDDDAPESRGRRRGPVGRRGGDPRLSVRDGDLYFGEPGEDDVQKLVRLTEDGAEKELATVSPDGAWVSYVSGNDLAVVRVEDASLWRVTEDGGPSMFCGILDWVYQEELYGRGDFRAHWWSPDGGAVAFLRLDEADVKTFTIVDFVPKPKLLDERSVEPEFQKYPKAGDPNPTAKLLVAHPATRKVVPVDLSGYAPDVLVVRVGWAPDGRVLFMVQDRIQTWLDLNLADPATGAVTRLLRETSDSWVNRLPFPRWRDDGTFLWLSERTGYQHLYHYQGDGELIRAVTAGDWQVTGIERVADVESPSGEDGAAPAAETVIWFTATKDGAINSNLYRVGLAGGEVQRLTQGPGRHSVSLNEDGSWFLDSVSAIDQPPEVRLCKGDGSDFSVLDRAEPRDVKSYVYSPKQQLVITARDGYPLDATLIKPPDWDPAKGPYPIYLPTYSGPDAPSVRNSFSVSTREQFLAQQGALILQVNVRSASGRGQLHTGMAYKRLGVHELRDLEDAVDHVVAEYAGDPKRVCIDGWSYGGFMAAYALTHSEKFTLGIAGAGVHDWQLYDTIYTERYMSTPQKNPEGYRETSVIEAAKNLNDAGHLVLMHGGRDDNVHLQNTMRLVFELQAAGKDNFELMIYPRDRHGVRSPHRQRVVWRALRDHLLAARP